MIGEEKFDSKDNDLLYVYTESRNFTALLITYNTSKNRESLFWENVLML